MSLIAWNHRLRATGALQRRSFRALCYTLDSFVQDIYRCDVVPLLYRRQVINTQRLIKADGRRYRRRRLLSCAASGPTRRIIRADFKEFSAKVSCYYEIVSATKCINNRQDRKNT